MEDNEKDYEVLVENEMEFATDSVLRIGDDYFLRHANGGERGAFQESTCRGKFTTVSITRTEARAKMLEMGVELEEVAGKTK